MQLFQQIHLQGELYGRLQHWSTLGYFSCMFHLSWSVAVCRAASRPAENAASHVTLQVENISLDCEAKGFQEVVDPRGSIFYEEAAAAAAALGISIDLYVISSEVRNPVCVLYSFTRFWG
jgi:hypothetical protein